MIKELKEMPWISVLFHPRSTIRSVQETNFSKQILILAILNGIVLFFYSAEDEHWGDNLSPGWFVIVAILGSPLLGLFTLYLFGVFVKWTGKLLKGGADAKQIRLALSYGYIPFIFMSLILWIILLSIFGFDVFASGFEDKGLLGRHLNNADSLNPGMTMLTIVMVIIAFPIMIITMLILPLIITSKCIGEVQGFSAWKGLSNYLLAIISLVFSGIIFAIIIGLFVMNQFTRWEFPFN
ncbi:MAG: hypothetical protein P9L92_08820 [Candidatus Electryonea clarkiae]|nr:hypothetical protein [Candidatus Electryonea clarkiae]MDP8286327.1 hypothetical protein [Candidatus Electryonea clarkiae]